MTLGRAVRLRRLFSHPSGRFCSVAVDHFVNYSEGLPPALRRMRETLAALMSGRPDAVTMMKGVAMSLWQPYAGEVPLIIQTIAARPDDKSREQMATVEEVVRLGADAVAAAAFIKGPTEASNLRPLADLVRAAEPYGLPVIAHIYPRRFDERAGASFSHGASISLDPEDIAWAVHCGLELGVDVVKTPYCGDVAAFADIIADCPLPVIVAGGPKTTDLAEALTTTGEAVRAGARGATIGRNIWGHARVTAALRAFQAVVHDGSSAAEALQLAGLCEEQPSGQARASSPMCIK